MGQAPSACPKINRGRGRLRLQFRFVDRVPDSTSDEVNERIRFETDRNIAYYTQQNSKLIQNAYVS